MTQLFLGVSALLALAILCAGCASAPVLIVPTPVPFALPTLIPPTHVPPTETATLTPTPPPTIVPPTPTVAPTQEMLAATITAATVTPSPVATPTPMPTPTTAIARGLYVTDLRIDPPPARGVDLKFTALFLNGLGQEQNYRWAVYIFRADTQRQTGETSHTDVPIPTGASERQSNGSWKLPLGGPCDYFFAQVGWLNAENKIVWLNNPSGATFQKGFAVCPP